MRHNAFRQKKNTCSDIPALYIQVTGNSDLNEFLVSSKWRKFTVRQLLDYM